jgi:hypothetical protein
MSSENPKANKPAHKIRRGVLQVTIWRNTSEKGTIWYNVDLSRGFKQGEDWKETTSLNQDDLLPMAKLLDEADTWIANQYSAAAHARNKQAETADA